MLSQKFKWAVLGSEITVSKAPHVLRWHCAENHLGFQFRVEMLLDNLKVNYSGRCSADKYVPVLTLNEIGVFSRPVMVVMEHSIFPVCLRRLQFVVQTCWQHPGPDS